MALTTLGHTGLAGCNGSNSSLTTDSKAGVVPRQVNSNSPTNDPYTNREGQHKRIVLTGELGIILPRTSHPYGTIKDTKSGKNYNIYGNGLTLHGKLMEKFHTMYDVKKWPVDVTVSGFLEAPDFIDSYSENIITITDVDQVEQVEGNIR